MKTVKTLTSQKLVNIIVPHLLKQNARSVMKSNSKVCLYRGLNGRMCAVGAVIKDEHYNEDLEGISISIIFDRSGEKLCLALKRSGIDVDSDYYLLSQLQWIHDNISVNKWNDRLKCFLKSNHLRWFKKWDTIQTQ